MSYDLYLNGVLMPVTPAKVQLKYKSQNKTVNLINDGEVNIIKSAGLEEVAFDLLIPNQSYPFANYGGGYRGADYYASFLRGLREGGSVFQFILARHKPTGSNLGNTNITVTMEDLTVTDDAKEGFDLTASVKLKQYKPYGTKTFTMSGNTASADGERAASAEQPQTGSSYTVQKGDCLWKIAQQHYGKGSDYGRIYDANNNQISNPNLIYPGQVIYIP